MLSNGLDGIKPALSYTSIFLVRKLFLEGFDGSVETGCQSSLSEFLWGLVSATVAITTGS